MEQMEGAVIPDQEMLEGQIIAAAEQFEKFVYGSGDVEFMSKKQLERELKSLRRILVDVVEHPFRKSQEIETEMEADLASMGADIATKKIIFANLVFQNEVLKDENPLFMNGTSD